LRNFYVSLFITRKMRANNIVKSKSVKKKSWESRQYLGDTPTFYLASRYFGFLRVAVAYSTFLKTI